MTNKLNLNGLGSQSSPWLLVTATAAVLPRVLLYGPKGTGKTHLALHAGNPARASRVPLSEDTPAAELRGFYVPHGDHWEWEDGPVMDLFRNGGRLVADEITRATDDALSFMLAVLDGEPVTLPTGETVYPHPDFTVWATTNDDPSALTEALADRFTIKVETKEVNPDALALLPAPLAAAVTSDGGGVTLRQAREFVRLSPLTGPQIAARLIWEGRGRDVLYGLELAASDLGSEAA